jgi:hypothetical protein
LLFSGVLSLSLSAWAVLEVGISRARCRSLSTSASLLQNVFILYLPLKNSVIEFETQIVIKFNFQSILLV